MVVVIYINICHNKNMKKVLTSIILSVFVPLFAHAQEQITNFDVEIAINADASIDVIETISYDFGNRTNPHGIYREIPYKYSARGGRFSLKISDISVTDENGAVRNTDISRHSGAVKIKIGKADVIANKKEIYKIQYRVDEALNYFENHDELYWNITGDEWSIPIIQSSAIVKSPNNTLLKESTCFVGKYGATESCKVSEDTGINQIFTARTLTPGEGFTVVASIKKGLVTQPSLTKKILRTIKDNLILLLPVGVSILMLGHWWRRGKDPRSGTVVPQWEIPDNLTPLECGLLIDEKVHRNDISSLFIDLAIKGYFSIEKIAKKGLFRKEDFTLEKIKEWKSEVTKSEKLFLEGLFKKGDETKLSTLKNTFYKVTSEITEEAYKNMSQNGYFVKNPQTVRGIYMITGFITSFGSVFLNGIIGAAAGPIGIGSVFVCGIIIFLFGLIMPKRTKKGVQVRDQILGLKMYMETAEERRIKMFNDPDKLPPQTTATFERYLPYAMILNVEDKWAQQFKDIYKGGEPSWYHGAGKNLSTGSISNSTKSFAAAAGAVAMSQPSSSSSGGSGFSGGGSGGGGGGGGGGSW